MIAKNEFKDRLVEETLKRAHDHCLNLTADSVVGSQKSRVCHKTFHEMLHMTQIFCFEENHYPTGKLISTWAQVDPNELI
jgi:hypothetical protein